MTTGGAAAVTDVLRQALEGVARPLFVLDERWRFTHMNPGGAVLQPDGKVVELEGPVGPPRGPAVPADAELSL